MIKAVIFDLDGTILNTLADLSGAMNSMLRQFGYPQQPDLECHKQAIGTGAGNYVKKCLPPEVWEDDEQIDRCLANVKTAPYDGICDVLAFLKANNISINVLSNKPDAPTKALVKLWFSDFAPEHVYGERPEKPRKPDPTVPLEIADALGISPSEIAFVGDSGVDIATGLAAGMIPIGVLWGYRTREQLLESGATHLTETPAELISIFQSLMQ